MMMLKSGKILLTGLPGCGKTSAVIKILSSLGCQNAKGFYTEEIRENGVRKGFCWKLLDGREGILAHIDVKGPFRVGKYGVDVEGFEKFVVPVLETGPAELFVLDEIGKMECFSGRFVGAVKRLFASDRPVLATVAQKGEGLITEIKNYPGVKLFWLTRQNRDKIVTEILRDLSFLKKP
jgi:nucleoside-triphosphatase